MLSDVGYDNCLVKLLIDLIENVQRPHQRTVFHRKRVFVFPRIDFGTPFFGITFRNILGHFGDGFLSIGDDRNIYMNVSGNRCRVDVDMNNLGIWGKFMKLTGDTIVKTCTDGKKKITVGNSHICSISTMHAEISDKERMFRGDSTAAHNGCNNRNLSFFYNGGKNLICISNVNATAGEEQRLFCFLKHLQSFL